MTLERRSGNKPLYALGNVFELLARDEPDPDLARQQRRDGMKAREVALNLRGRESPAPTRKEEGNE